MSNIICAAKAAECPCGMTTEEIILGNLSTVPAGTVNGGLGVCGYQTELSMLPKTYIKPQTYTEGLCPDAARSLGTLFPELVDVYK